MFPAPDGKSSECQLEAFEDTWHWGDAAARAHDEVLTNATHTDAPVMMRGIVAAVGKNDIAAYLAMMVVRLIELHRVGSSRLWAMMEMVEDLALRGVAARVARLLLECSRGAPPLAEGAGDHCAHLTQQQLAAMTGTVREVVQRALKALEREGAIELARGQIRVIAPEILEAWSGAGRREG